MLYEYRNCKSVKFKVLYQNYSTPVIPFIVGKVCSGGAKPSKIFALRANCKIPRFARLLHFWYWYFARPPWPNSWLRLCIYHIISHFLTLRKNYISTKMYFCIALIGRIVLPGKLSLLTRWMWGARRPSTAASDLT